MEQAGQVKRISKRKSPQTIYQVVGFPNASESPISKSALTRGDVEYLATLKPSFVAGLDGTKVAGLHQVTLRRLQRLAGHGLIRSEALENAGDA